LTGCGIPSATALTRTRTRSGARYGTCAATANRSRPAAACERRCHQVPARRRNAAAAATRVACGAGFPAVRAAACLRSDQVARGGRRVAAAGGDVVDGRNAD